MSASIRTLSGKTLTLGKLERSRRGWEAAARPGGAGGLAGGARGAPTGANAGAGVCARAGRVEARREAVIVAKSDCRKIDRRIIEKLRVCKRWTRPAAAF